LISRPSLRPAIFLFSLGLSTLLSQADRVHFNDGRPPKEGKVVFNTPSVVELKWEKRPGIFQTDRFLKANIERVEIDTKEDIQFRNMGQMLPAPDRLTPEDYQRRIVKCKAFLDLFPNGSHASKVELILRTLEEEYEKAVAGGLKLQNKWISPEERRRDAYGIDAGLEYADMVAAKESSDLKMALRHFEKIQSDFAGSTHYAKASALAIETMKSYQPILQQRIAQVQFKRQDRERARATLPANVRAQNKAAQDKADASYLKLVARETNEIKTKWLTLNEYHSDPMRKVLNTLKNTLSNLEKQTPSESSSFADSLHQDAWDAISRGDLEAVKEMLRELKSLKVPERYLTQIEEASEIQEETNQPLPADEKPVEAEKPAEEAPSEEEDEKTEAKEAKEESSKTPSTRPTNSVPSPSGSSADENSGTSKVQVIFVVVLLLVIVVALGAAFIGRKKK